MGVFDKLIGSMKLSDDEEFDDEEFYDDYEDDFEDKKPSSRRSNYMKRNDYDDLDDYQDDMDDYREKRMSSKRREEPVRSSSRSDDFDRNDRSDRIERSERSDHSDRNNRYERAERNVRTERPEKREERYEVKPEKVFTPEKSESKSVFGKKETVNKSSETSMGVCVIRPTAVEDSRDIVDKLLGGRTVVLNLEGLDIDVAQRIIDFTSGACYAISGNLQKISQYIFLLTPSSVDISGDINNLIGEGMSSYDN